MHRRQLLALALAALVAPLAACLDSTVEPETPPAEVPIESASFATALGVNIPGSTKTSSGVYFRDLNVGTGATLTPGQIVSVRYTGWLSTGEQFDSNVSSATPLEFTLGSRDLIPGFDQGVTGMRVGGRRQVVIPPGLAYGPFGRGPIPGNAILVFNIEVVGVR